MLIDLVFEVLADVVGQDVARFVLARPAVRGPIARDGRGGGGDGRTAFFLLEELGLLRLRALRDDDDGVAPPRESPFEPLEDLVHAPRRFGDEHKVDVLRRHGGVSGDKARGAAHQLDETHAVGRCLRLNVRGHDGSDGLLDGRIESKRLIDNWDVVIDGFWNSRDNDAHSARRGDAHKLQDAAVRAIAADDVQNVDAAGSGSVEDFICIEAATGRPKDGTALVMDFGDAVWGEAIPWGAIVEAAVAWGGGSVSGKRKRARRKRGPGRGATRGARFVRSCFTLASLGHGYLPFDTP